MKYIFFLIPIIFLFLIGCSSTYKITDYPSKETFYKDINSSIRNRDVKVLTADSSFTALEGSQIKAGSLQIVSLAQKTIPLQEVKNVKYFETASATPKVYVWLKNGEELKPESIQKLSNSMIQLKNLRISDESISIFKIKEISYKTGWPGALTGIPIGFGSGAIVGGILGSAGIIFHINSGGMKDTFDKEQSTFVGMVSGALTGIITGGILGYIIGWEHKYKINY